jgi:hypothetical protein
MSQQNEGQKKFLTEIMEADAKNGLYKQQTAVEWLELIYYSQQGYLSKKDIEQAKAMEKEQRQKDWDEGFESGAKSPEDVPLKINKTVTL